MSKPVFDIKPLMIQKIYKLSVASKSDVAMTTKLIQKAYSYWNQQGVVVAPATQSEEKTASHILEGKGFVLKDDKNNIVGTFSLDELVLESKEAGVLAKARHSDFEVLFTATTDKNINGNFLEFKKLAVDASLGKQGLGRELYDIAEKHARDNGFEGMVLETVKEAAWLYDWYIDMGYEVYGKYVYGTSGLETLLLVKRF